MLLATIIYGTLIVFLLWFILSRLADIYEKLANIEYRNFNIECENPADHFKFTEGGKD